MLQNEEGVVAHFARSDILALMNLVLGGDSSPCSCVDLRSTSEELAYTRVVRARYHRSVTPRVGFNPMSGG